MVGFRYGYGKLPGELPDKESSTEADYLLIAPSDNPNSLHKIRIEDLGGVNAVGGGFVFTPTLNYVDPGGISLNYNSLGDTNGLLYYYGTDKNMAAFSNPQNKSSLDYKVIVSGNGTGHSYLSDRVTAFGQNYDNSTTNGYIIFQFPEAFSLSSYTIKSSQFAGYYPNSWTISGSNDGTNWTTIDTRTNSSTWDNLHQWRLFEGITSDSYAYLQFNCTASTAGTRFLLDEFEFYGTLGDPPYDQTSIGIEQHRQLVFLDSVNLTKILLPGPSPLGFYCQVFKYNSGAIQFETDQALTGISKVSSSSQALLELYYLPVQGWIIRELIF
jgi:hypothetical protein